jgi:hypothetical protein
MRSDISIKNYTELILPKLRERQKKIYDIISKHPNRINSLDLEKEIGKERHKFSGRITELVKMDLIKVDRMQKVGDSTFGVWRTKNNIDKDGQINIF